MKVIKIHTCPTNERQGILQRRYERLSEERWQRRLP